jgi:hypothetical protein
MNPTVCTNYALATVIEYSTRIKDKIKPIEDGDSETPQL